MGPEWWVGLLSALPSAFSGGGITGGVTLGIFGRLISQEKLWFNRSVQRVIDEKDNQLADLREQTDKRIAEKDGELTRMGEELGRMTTDRDYWRTSAETDRTRADLVTTQFTNDYFPLLERVNATFARLANNADEAPK
jgi:hypothetical protein